MAFKTETLQIYEETMADLVREHNLATEAGDASRAGGLANHHSDLVALKVYGGDGILVEGGFDKKGRPKRVVQVDDGELLDAIGNVRAYLEAGRSKR